MCLSLSAWHKQDLKKLPNGSGGHCLHVCGEEPRSEIPYCIVLYHIMSYCVILYYIVSYFITLSCIVSPCAILFDHGCLRERSLRMARRTFTHSLLITHRVHAGI